jgi:hypothetical protein
LNTVFFIVVYSFFGKGKQNKLNKETISPVFLGNCQETVLVVESASGIEDALQEIHKIPAPVLP